MYSAFDKDGMPRRPRKQRKLRFDPSFSPGCGISDGDTMRTTGLDWLRDHHDTSRDNDKFNEEHGQHRGAGVLCGTGPSQMAMVRAPDTPDKPLTNEGLTGPYRRFSVHDHLLEPTHVSPPAISIGIREKIPPVRMIDFTNLPPPTRRWRFPNADTTKSGNTGTMLSIMKPTDQKVKTPKKITFANHAQVCVYTTSPRRQDAKDDTGAVPACQCSGEDSEDGLEVNGKSRMSSDNVEGYADSTVEAMKDLVPQTRFLEMNDDPTRRLKFENDTLTLTMEEVQAMRRRLLESAATNGVDNGELATLFELGKTFRGMQFRHVW